MSAIKETAIGAALRFGGILREDVEFDVAITKYLNSGGTIERALARLNAAAERMSGMGRKDVAYTGHMPHAQTRQPVEGGGAKTDVPQGQPSLAAPPSSNHDERGHDVIAPSGQTIDASSRRVPDRGGEGHRRSAEIGQRRLALPVREPPKPARGIASIASIQSVVKQSFMFNHKTSDGRAWGDVGWHELPGMKRDGAIARLIIERVAAPPDQFSKLNDILTDAQFMELHNVAQKQIAAV